MRLRAAGSLLLALTVLAGACTSGSEPQERESGTGTSTMPSTPSSARTLARTACANTSHEALLRTWRGVRLDRSGDIQIVPKDPNFVNGGLTHATPFDYSQDVPLLLYGPGYVRPGEYDEPITLADLAPALGALLKSPFDTPEGDPQAPALLPEAERDLPRLGVTVIWDPGSVDESQKGIKLVSDALEQLAKK